MDHFVEKALAFTDLCAQSSDATVLLDAFGILARDFGFNHFIMTGLPSYGEDVEQLIVANAWPSGWTDRYREGSYFFHDPVSREALRSARKYTWAEARSRHPATRTTLQIEDEASSIGLADGIALPLFDPENWQAVVSLSSDAVVVLPQRAQLMMYVAAGVCHGRLTELLRPEHPSLPELSPREREVLTWIAAGKTRSEAGDILGITENTVKAHLREITSKLRVSNTTQAVARAMHHRQIQL